jgi:MarR family transcriptional regulator, lower aerobic nicotinate degradation pathway regulator
VPSPIQPPLRLRSLVSWQANKVATLGARLTARHMPLNARTDFAVLAALEEYGPLSQAELGRRLGLDRNDISTVVGHLHRDGALQRRPDEADPRRNLVTVTDSGLRYLAELQEHADVVQRDLLAGLDEPQRRQLVDLLNQVLAHHPGQSA